MCYAHKHPELPCPHCYDEITDPIPPELDEYDRSASSSNSSTLSPLSSLSSSPEGLTLLNYFELPPSAPTGIPDSYKREPSLYTAPVGDHPSPLGGMCAYPVKCGAHGQHYCPKCFAFLEEKKHVIFDADGDFSFAVPYPVNPSHHCDICSFDVYPCLKKIPYTGPVFYGPQNSASIRATCSNLHCGHICCLNNATDDGLRSVIHFYNLADLPSPLLDRFRAMFPLPRFMRPISSLLTEPFLDCMEYAFDASSMLYDKSFVDHIPHDLQISWCKTYVDWFHRHFGPDLYFWNSLKLS